MVALCKKFRNLKTISDLIYLVFCLKKSKEKLSGDDKFIYWLRDCREAGLQVSLSQVKAKVSEILSSHGQADVEKTCKWFLLWHNRWKRSLHVSMGCIINVIIILKANAWLLSKLIKWPFVYLFVCFSAPFS